MPVCAAPRESTFAYLSEFSQTEVNLLPLMAYLLNLEVFCVFGGKRLACELGAAQKRMEDATTEHLENWLLSVDWRRFALRWRSVGAATSERHCVFDRFYGRHS